MEKIKEWIRYGIVGVLTTVVNYMVYYIGLKLNLNWLCSNTMAWIAAVIFAYIANRKVVFHSKNEIKKECIEFFGLRFLTLMIENLLLGICIDGINLSNFISKIIVSIVTVIMNYGLCKTQIFSKKGGVLYE